MVNFSHLKDSNPTPYLKKINDICSISSDYNTYILDIAGVVHDGVTAYPGSIECINILIDNKKNIIFLSNSSRLSNEVKNELFELGISPNIEVLTAGDLAKTMLVNRYRNKTIFHIGTKNIPGIIREISFNITTKIEEADLILLTTFPKQNRSENELTYVIKRIVELNLPVLCVNPDIKSPSGQESVLCAGDIAQRLLTLGGKVEFSGKPYKIAYESLIDRFPFVLADKSKILIIGDSPDTDIQGANYFGVDSLLVLSGNMKGINLDSYLSQQSNPLYYPTYYMESLLW